MPTRFIGWIAMSVSELPPKRRYRRSMDSRQAFSFSMQGQRKDYALERAPSGVGGQAQVFRAVHKPTNQTVAFKRLHRPVKADIARMKREIEVGMQLDSPHVMPVLDSSPTGKWLVMPWADGDLTSFRSELLAKPDSFREMIDSVIKGLAAAHAEGWIHRDVTPSNILRLSIAEESRWVVSDWGLVRRPRGKTTDPGRTRLGSALGTEGFAAPELSVDAHGADTSVDVYSIGQVIGWVFTESQPVANVPLLPADGPWRTVAREATYHSASKRPLTMEDLTQLISQVVDDPHLHAASVAAQLVESINNGDTAKLVELASLAETGDYDILIDVLPSLPESAIRILVGDYPEKSRGIVEGYKDALGRDWGSRNFGHANNVIGFLLDLAIESERQGDLDLLADTASVLFEWDGMWDQWAVQRRIRTWLEKLTNDAASVVAVALRRHPDSASHFDDLTDNRRIDPRMRSAIRDE